MGAQSSNESFKNCITSLRLRHRKRCSLLARQVWGKQHWCKTFTTNTRATSITATAPQRHRSAVRHFSMTDHRMNQMQRQQRQRQRQLQHHLQG